MKGLRFMKCAPVLCLHALHAALCSPLAVQLLVQLSKLLQEAGVGADVPVLGHGLDGVR